MDEDTTAYSSNGSLPVVGTSTGVLAATGKPVAAVTPEPPMKAAAELLVPTEAEGVCYPARVRRH